MGRFHPFTMFTAFFCTETFPRFSSVFLSLARWPPLSCYLDLILRFYGKLCSSLVIWHVAHEKTNKSLIDANKNEVAMVWTCGKIISRIGQVWISTVVRERSRLSSMYDSGGPGTQIAYADSRQDDYDSGNGRTTRAIPLHTSACT